jgi:TPR repeat protein
MDFVNSRTPQVSEGRVHQLSSLFTKLDFDNRPFTEMTPPITPDENRSTESRRLGHQRMESIPPRKPLPATFRPPAHSNARSSSPPKRAETGVRLISSPESDSDHYFHQYRGQSTLVAQAGYDDIDHTYSQLPSSVAIPPPNQGHPLPPPPPAHQMIRQESKTPLFDSNFQNRDLRRAYNSSIPNRFSVESSNASSQASSTRGSLNNPPRTQLLPRHTQIAQIGQLAEAESGIISSGASMMSSSSIPVTQPERSLQPSPPSTMEEEAEFVALQYHHEDLERMTEAAAAAMHPVSTPSPSEGFRPSSRHLHLPTPSPQGRRQSKRPESALSEFSDNSNRSMRNSPNVLSNLHSRHNSTYSGFSNESHVSMHDITASYPQPPPINVNGDNAHLQNMVGENASLLRPEQTLDLYRANAKKTNDMGIQFEFALHLINYAMELMPDPRLSAYSEEDRIATPDFVIARRAELLKEAKQMLDKLSNRSYPYAQYYLGDAYSSGMFGKPDNAAAFRLFVSAAKHGHAEGAYRAALSYEFGWGCRVEPAKAVQFYEAAASKNHPGAMLRLGKACCFNDLGFKNQYKNGVKWLKRATESADVQYPQAPYELGLLHETGFRDLVFQDPTYTAQLFTQAAALGHVEANYRLGDAYEHGKLGCPRDAGLSVHYYTGAAMKDHPAAMMALCAWYMVGAPQVLEQNEEEAYEWAKRAADYGKFLLYSSFLRVQ